MLLGLRTHLGGLRFVGANGVPHSEEEQGWPGRELGWKAGLPLQLKVHFQGQHGS